MKDKFLLGLVIIAFLLLGGIFWQVLLIPKEFESGQSPRLGSVYTSALATSTAVNVTSTARLIFPGASGAIARSVFNPSVNGSSSVAWIQFGTSTGLVAGKGYALAVSSTLTLCDNGCNLPMFDGLIYGITANTNTSTTLSMSQF